jgi:hypothetical protein
MYFIFCRNSVRGRMPWHVSRGERVILHLITLLNYRHVLT